LAHEAERLQTTVFVVYVIFAFLSYARVFVVRACSSTQNKKNMQL